MSGTAELSPPPAAVADDAALDAPPPPEPLATSEPSVALELRLHPDDAAKLARLPEITALATGRLRPAALELIWHDTPDAALAGLGLSLCEARLGGQRACRLEQLRAWPGLQPALASEATALAELADALPTPLAPMAALHGQGRAFRLAPDAPIGAVELWTGTLRTVAAERPVARLRLRGTPDAVFDLALTLAASLRIGVAAVSLAAEALALAQPHGRSRPPSPPTLEAGLSVSEAFSRLAGQLTAVLLHHAPAAAAGAAPEPVHQMRVALRRLRSAMSLFSRATGCAELDAAKTQLKPLAAALGPARDWDVFTAGTGRAVAAAFEDDVAVARLLSAAERRRVASYRTLRETLESPDFRVLALTLVRLAVTRPWERALDADPRRAELLDADLRHYAAHALSRRLRHARMAGEDPAAMSLSDLHALRIQCKRLRYAAEFFAPLFPGRDTRRFVRGLGVLQERLGHLNDGAVAGGLMASLGGSGGRALAAGVVRGFVAAQTQDVRAKAERSWRKFQHIKTFW